MIYVTEYNILGEFYTEEELHNALENDEIKEVNSNDDDLFYEVQDELDSQDMNEVINQMINGCSFFEAMVEMGYVDVYDGTCFTQFENVANQYDGQYGQ